MSDLHTSNINSLRDRISASSENADMSFLSLDVVDSNIKKPCCYRYNLYLTDEQKRNVQES